MLFATRPIQQPDDKYKQAIKYSPRIKRSFKELKEEKIRENCNKEIKKSFNSTSYKIVKSGYSCLGEGEAYGINVGLMYRIIQNSF